MSCERKIGVIGVGHVGAHVANSLILQGVADKLYLCDPYEKKLVSEVQDLSDAVSFCPHQVEIISVHEEYERLADCDIIINSSGKVALSLDPEQGRDGELDYTTALARGFIARVTDAGFSGIWINIANPCDVVTTEIHHIVNQDPRKIIGVGTCLDSARLKNALSQATGIDQNAIQAYMLGEHGDSMFAAWSSVRFGNIALDYLRQEHPDIFSFNKEEVETQARKGGFVTASGKNCTEYGIANAAVEIAKAVVSDTHSILPCSCLLDGEYGEEGIYTSLPCVIGKDGVQTVLAPELSEQEVQKFKASCAHVRENIEKLSWW